MALLDVFPQSRWDWEFVFNEIKETADLVEGIIGSLGHDVVVVVVIVVIVVVVVVVNSRQRRRVRGDNLEGVAGFVWWWACLCFYVPRHKYTQRGGHVEYIYVFVLKKHKIGLNLRLIYVKLT